MILYDERINDITLYEIVRTFHTSPILFLARNLSFLLYSFLFYFSSFAASTLAGLSRLGSTSIEVTDTNTASIVRIGFHFYDSFY